MALHQPTPAAQPNNNQPAAISVNQTYNLTATDDEATDKANLQQLRTALAFTQKKALEKLQGNEPTPTNIIRMFWNEHVFSKLSTDFQLQDSGMQESPSVDDWTQFLSVVLQASFFNCASFDELYELEEYGAISSIMRKCKFMAMKKGLSSSKVPGDKQVQLNSDYDLVTGEDRMGDLEEWEKLLSTISSPFVEKESCMMIDDDRFSSQADAGAIATQTNSKESRSRPLGDAACTSDLQMIVVVSVRRRESETNITSVERYMSEIDAGRNNNLTLSQSKVLRFLYYLLYNAYVIHRVLAVHPISGQNSHATEDPTAVLSRIKKEWEEFGIRRFVSQINRSIRVKGAQLLRPHTLGVSADAVEDKSGDEAPGIGVPSSDNRKSWPKRHRLVYADREPWKSQRLTSEWPHDVRYHGRPLPCVLCTTFERGKPVGKKRQTSYSCSGCDNIPLCIKPDPNGQRRSCFARWHSIQRLIE